MIRVTSIASDNLSFFESFMSRQAVSMVKNKYPLLALGALDDETACGAITGYMETGSSFRINGLFMAPASRRRGGAALLLRALSELLSEEERIETVKIDYIELGDEERGLSALLEAAGFLQETPDIHFFRTTLEGLSDGDFFRSTREKDEAVISFSEMPDYLIRSIDKHFAFEGAPIVEGPLLGKALEREVSSGVADGSGIPAFDVITKESDRLHIAFLYAEPRFSSRLPQLLQTSVRRANEKYPPETPVTMQTVNRNGEHVARRVMEGTDFHDLARSAVFTFSR